MFTKNYAMNSAAGYDKAPTHSTINLIKKQQWHQHQNPLFQMTSVMQSSQLEVETTIELSHQSTTYLLVGFSDNRDLFTLFETEEEDRVKYYKTF